jgi:hypothetical protein
MLHMRAKYHRTISSHKQTVTRHNYIVLRAIGVEKATAAAAAAAAAAVSAASFACT